MATIEEAAAQLGKDLIAQNMPALLMALTPEGMMKAMALQGQLMAAGAAALAAGMPLPPPATKAEFELKGDEGADTLVNLLLESTAYTAEVQTKWRQIEGVWKVNDFLLLGVKDKDGNAVPMPTLPGMVAPAPPPPAASA